MDNYDIMTSLCWASHSFLLHYNEDGYYSLAIKVTAAGWPIIQCDTNYIQVREALLHHGQEQRPPHIMEASSIVLSGNLLWQLCTRTSSYLHPWHHDEPLYQIDCDRHRVGAVPVSSLSDSWGSNMSSLAGSSDEWRRDGAGQTEGQQWEQILFLNTADFFCNDAFSL